MRLIDGDALCNDLLNRWHIADIRKEELIRAVMADIVTPIVACQPTIEERKNGKWIPLISTSDGKHHEWCGYQCSICGERTLRLMQHNFCPNCGVEMMEE